MFGLRKRGQWTYKGRSTQSMVGDGKEPWGGDAGLRIRLRFSLASFIEICLWLLRKPCLARALLGFRWKPILL